MLRGSNAEEIICQTLIELMQKKSLIDIKVTELVKHANISRSSFYIYFSSIEDVVQKIEDDFISGLKDEKSIDFRDLENRDSVKLLPTLQYIKENMYTYKTLIGENGDPYFQYRLSNRSTKLLMEFNSGLSDVKKRMIIEYINGGRWQMYKWWAQNEEEVTIEEVADLTNRIIKQVFNLLNE